MKSDFSSSTACFFETPSAFITHSTTESDDGAHVVQDHVLTAGSIVNIRSAPSWNGHTPTRIWPTRFNLTPRASARRSRATAAKGMSPAFISIFKVGPTVLLGDFVERPPSHEEHFRGGSCRHRLLQAQEGPPCDIGNAPLQHALANQDPVATTAKIVVATEHTVDLAGQSALTFKVILFKPGNATFFHTSTTNEMASFQPRPTTFWRISMRRPRRRRRRHGGDGRGPVGSARS